MAVDCGCCRVLLPQLSPVLVDDICRVGGVVRIAAHPRARGARRGRCGRVSTRVHSSYRRRLADRPVAGQPVVVRLRVRRFFCDRDDCCTGTFAEQVTGLTERHAQRSTGLESAQVALALAGRAGSRLATALGMPVSRSTLLRRIRRLPDPCVGPVTVLGVDEFAVRHEALFFRMEVEDLGRPVVAAMGRSWRQPVLGERRGRVGAAATKSGRFGTAGRAVPGEQDGKVYAKEPVS